MAKDNVTTYIILGFLNHESSTGYDIKRKIDGSISQFWNVGFSQIYPTLKKMEADGLVMRKIEDGVKGPERIMYSITKAGQAALQEWIEVPVSKEYVRYEILCKLFFGNIVSEQENKKRIKEFKERYQKELMMLNMFESNLKTVLSESDDHFYFYLTVLFGKELYEAYLRWADMATMLIEQKNSASDNIESRRTP